MPQSSHLARKTLKNFAQKAMSYRQKELYFNLLCLLRRLKGLAYVIKGSMPLRPCSGKARRMPISLQFPITYRCNQRCKMCGIPGNELQDADITAIRTALKDKLFNEIVQAGINGGEPFLVRNVEEYVNALLELPKLHAINIISNGILTACILEKLEIIYKSCASKNVFLGVTFSLDGHRDIHEEIRGVKGSFDKTVESIKSIQRRRSELYDYISLICTVSKYNVRHLNELLAFAELNELPEIDFQLAVAHKRLDNLNRVSEFSVLENEYDRSLASEFFYGQFIKTRKPSYYFIHKYLESGGHGRMMSCGWADRDATLCADGSIFYCAVSSKRIGGLGAQSLYSQFFSQENIVYRCHLLKAECDSCIHYSTWPPYYSSWVELCEHDRQRAAWTYKYLRLGETMK